MSTLMEARREEWRKVTAELQECVAGLLEESGMTPTELSLKISDNRDYVGYALRNKDCLFKPFINMATLLPIPAELINRLRDARASFYEIQSAVNSMTQADSWDEQVRQPWPETVDKLKEQPPIYSRPW